MAFTSQDSYKAVNGGEQWTTAPCAATNYTNFQDGLETGRFAQLKAGILSNLDGTTTPDLAGVVLLRKSSALEDGTAISAENNVDVDVADFGRVSVYVVPGVVPVEGESVYAYNNTDNGTENWGMATNAEANLASDGTTEVANASVDAVFYKEVKAGVWIVTLKQYMK